VINYLKSKLGKFQSTSETLEDENLKLSKELEVSRINLRDINEFLTNELKARSLTSAALEQKVINSAGSAPHVSAHADVLWLFKF
jgi:hypothetical protein